MSFSTQVASEDGDESGRFATLSPDNQAAQDALRDVVNSLREDGGDDGYQSSFIEEAAPASGPNSQAPNYQFVLSFDQFPGGPDGSWEFGAGSSAGFYRDVDLLLCPLRALDSLDDAPTDDRINPTIGLISLHPKSGSFLLEAMSEKHPITYLSGDGNTDTVLHHGQTSVLHMTRNRFRFGPFQYLLEFHTQHESRFVAARNRYIADNILPHGGMDIYPQLDPLPRQGHHRVRDSVFHRTMAYGAFGMVKSGVHMRTGDAVAIKTLHCKARQIPSVRNELNLAASFTPDTIGIIPTFDTWCEHGLSPPCFGTAIEDVHLAMPLARYDFDSTPWADVDPKTRLGLFHQTLQGLEAIHDAGIMHRDISPRNLLVLSLDPPEASICDFGKALRSGKGHDTTIGPIDTVAPEVWTSKERGYSNAIDIWSLAYTWLCSLQRPTNLRHNAKTDLQRHKKLIATLLACDISPALRNLMRDMLSFDPRDRPTATEALVHELWEEIEELQAGSPELGLRHPEIPAKKRPRLDDASASADLGPLAKSHKMVASLPDTLPWTSGSGSAGEGGNDGG
ncbi:kinase-like domain-containing protein [Pseudomassariella vexata]|uniref:EKC/KEOPS complex subunit BUD32 n=1 Tax=Pseudomassariella vexata TaxID=1141098 RepID=A0A1Y2D9G6_9PEZI|nr:kinase-like domain-containing protein [Pseudomassariella vexata]ORY55901.1 kinase-like domain-containing protein [Pseudomassariella vexata]